MGPSWYDRALKDVGQHEIGNNGGPYVKSIIAAAHCGSIGDPWCAIFVNAMLEDVGLRGTRSPSSQSFRHDPNFVALDGPAIGAITVFWRISKSSGLGHVAFYAGENSDGFILSLGGNESDAVRLELLSPSAAHFGLVGYYWPKTMRLPVIGRVVVTGHQPGTSKVT
jgi:uncharacterized protein (TIGR02594 family)